MQLTLQNAEMHLCNRLTAYRHTCLHATCSLHFVQQAEMPTGTDASKVQRDRGADNAQATHNRNNHAKHVGFYVP